MRRLVLTIPLLTVGLACTSRAPAPVPEIRPEAEAARRVRLGDELAGETVTASADGPWQIRTTRAGGSDAGPAERKSLGVGAPAKAEGALHLAADDAFDVPADSREPSDPPPAPAMSPATPGAEPGVTAFGGAGGADGGLEEVEEERSRVEPGAVAMSKSAPVQQLRAGATDDNADYAAYLEFLATWVDRKDIQELYQPLDVSDRRFVRVVDADGRPVPGAVVSIVDELADRVLWTATTYGDGRVPYYPALGGAAAVGADRPLLIEAFVRDADGVPRGVRAPWDGSGAEIQVALPDPFRLPDPIRLDVCFVIDTTGSMGDEIESIKASLLKVTEQLRGLDREFDLRYSAVLYRDIGDAYVTATHAFTDDIEAFDTALRGVGAAGGGDGPESLNQAVAQAVDGVAWRDDAAKVAFLIADAPPHMDYADDVPYGESARAAVARGIRIHSVAASGLDPVGTLVFRQIAQLTRGKFIFIEYGSAEATAASHGVAGKVKTDNLEDILFAQLRDEVATYGR